jgi:hypothetical protein
MKVFLCLTAICLAGANEMKILEKFAKNVNRMFSTDASIDYDKNLSCSACIRSGNSFCKNSNEQYCCQDEELNCLRNATMSGLICSNLNIDSSFKVFDTCGIEDQAHLDNCGTK